MSINKISLYKMFFICKMSELKFYCVYILDFKSLSLILIKKPDLINLFVYNSTKKGFQGHFMGKAEYHLKHVAALNDIMVWYVLFLLKYSMYGNYTELLIEKTHIMLAYHCRCNVGCTLLNLIL